MGLPLLQRGPLTVVVLQHQGGHPADAAFLRDISDETRLVVSEPLGTLPGAWNEVPESSYGIIQPGHDALHAFRPDLQEDSGAEDWDAG